MPERPGPSPEEMGMESQKEQGPTAEQLYALLRTPAEERRITEKSGEVVFEKKEFGGPESSVVLLGTKHTSDLEKMSESYRTLTESEPDVLMHEGKNVRDLFPGLSDDDIRALDPSVVAGKQEQAYIAWKAFVDGIEVRSWDLLPVQEQFVRIMEMKNADGRPKHDTEAIQAWFTSTALEKLYSVEHPAKPDRDNFEAIISVVITPQEKESLREAGLRLDPESLLKAWEKYSGKTREEFLERFDDPQLREQDHAVLRGLAEPQKSSGENGPTNRVLADMNLVRDQHAVDAMIEAKKKYKKVAVTAGASHVLTWEPAVESLYGEKR